MNHDPWEDRDAEEAAKSAEDGCPICGEDRPHEHYLGPAMPQGELERRFERTEVLRGWLRERLEKFDKAIENGADYTGERNLCNRVLQFLDDGTAYGSLAEAGKTKETDD